MIDNTIYLIQIAFLATCIPVLGLCIFMAWRSRLAFNGLIRGIILMLSALIVVLILLIIRRLDDAYGILNETTRLLLSSGVAIFIGASIFFLVLDLNYIYRNRHIYAMIQEMRKKREAEYEAIREKSERGISWNQAHKRIT